MARQVDSLKEGLQAIEAAVHASARQHQKKNNEYHKSGSQCISVRKWQRISVYICGCRFGAPGIFRAFVVGRRLAGVQIYSYIHNIFFYEREQGILSGN